MCVFVNLILLYEFLHFGAAKVHLFTGLASRTHCSGHNLGKCSSASPSGDMKPLFWYQLWNMIWDWYLRALPLPLAPLSTGNSWLVDCCNGSPFLQKTVSFVTLKSHFGCPEWPFRWSGDPRGHPGGTWRSRCAFLWILGSSWEPPGIHFGCIFVMFLWSLVLKWETVSRSMVLVIQGWKWW